ncbi:hypothetical protein L1987_85567 [Smallanthus sonchifolius]|uniref:Uncharacterized protein n=1 Tax=Smallanthus sonchifolius TaxID=185202 RepID=A0ACB8XXH6_9ASTR|nr:hypothetical protein L1987_85567 [Smallanthus sonchifolius]
MDLLETWLHQQSLCVVCINNQLTIFTGSDCHVLLKHYIITRPPLRKQQWTLTLTLWGQPPLVLSAMGRNSLTYTDGLHYPTPLNWTNNTDEDLTSWTSLTVTPDEELTLVTSTEGLDEDLTSWTSSKSPKEEPTRVTWINSLDENLTWLTSTLGPNEEQTLAFSPYRPHEDSTLDTSAYDDLDEQIASLLRNM